MVQPSRSTANSSTAQVNTSKRCDLCASPDFETIARTDRRGKPLETVVCRKCGLVAHAHIPTDDQLARYYATEYRQDYHGEEVPSDRRVFRAWNNGQRLLRQLAPLVGKREKVFEIGAGIGCNLKSFELAGYDASGIEPGEGFGRYASERLLARVERASLFDLPSVARHDLVLLIHVIEHFNSPRKALSHIRDLLPKGGRLYVECPNLAAPFARRAKLFHYAHIHNFTPHTLELMAHRCGYEVEKQFGSPRDPNLQMLLIRTETPRALQCGDSYAKTMAALARYNNLTYHLRPGYVLPRIRKVFSYLNEHRTAARQVAQLLERCKSQGENRNAVARRAA